MAGADDAGDAEHQAVVEERVERKQASGDAPGKGDAADIDVVRHDGGRNYRLNTQDVFGPHLVFVEVGDGVRAKVLGEVHHTVLWTHESDDCTKSRGGDRDRCCQQNVD